MGKDSKDEELKSFKISDLKRPEVRSINKGADEEVEAEASPSAGFPGVEQRLENGNIEAIADELRGTYEKLEALSSSGDMRTKPAAKKAMGAYERVADLFEYLFQTKEALQNPPSDADSA